MSLSVHPPSGMRRHGSPTGSGSNIRHRSLDHELPPELVEKKLVEESRRLAMENNQFAEAQVILKRDVIAAKEEMQKVQALIRSIETESNIQVRVAFEKAAKMELECREAPQVKMELEKSHKEAHEMMTSVQEMTSQLETAHKELEIARSDIKRIPQMISELVDMREERHRLCTTFEHEKRMNMEKVEHLQAMERDLINMARHIDWLQTDVSEAENALQTPAPVPYGVDLQSNSCQSHQPPTNGPYYIASTGSHNQMGVVQMNGTVAYPHGNPVIAPLAPPPLPPPPISPSPPPPPPHDPPVTSGEGSGGDGNTSSKSTDGRREVGDYESSESRVNEG